jgi:sarcosine oxidase
VSLDVESLIQFRQESGTVIDPTRREIRQNRYNIIVVGVGGMGSSALFHIARRGARVLGLEQFEIPHDQGSSHGLTRIIRLAYWEDPAYVPLLRRAYELWRGLEQLAGEPLLVTTGSVDAGAPDSRSIRGVLEACRRFDLAHETLSSSALHLRFPGYCLPDSLVAIYQPDGGFLLSERCITTHVSAALKLGATVHTRERVEHWEVVSGGVAVHTNRSTYMTDRLVITAGPWAGKAVSPLQPLLNVERQAVLWVAPRRADHFLPERFPVFYLHGDEGSFYGLPVLSDHGLKIGKYHHLQQVVDPDTVDRRCNADDESVLRQAIRRYFPDADGPTVSLKACLFTNTADEHFIIDVLPQHPEVCVAAGFSGHGFKFCSVVGEILADLALDGSTRHDISLFTLDRPFLKR